MARKKKQGRKGGDAGPVAGNGATTGYEAELWAMADALRGSMDAAEYKHVVLGLIFLKYISDAFEERHAAVLAEWGGEAAEDRDEYIAENIFWVPPEARWAHLKARARQAAVGRLVDDAMAAIERDNPTLKDVLPRDYARPALDKQRLGQLIDLISNVRVGDEDSRSRDVLGRVYEYFLSRFASAEGKKGGEFYTPRCVWSSSWWRCWSRGGGGSTTRAAAPRGCSCSPSSSSARTPGDSRHAGPPASPARAATSEERPRSLRAATGAAGRAPIFPSTARNRITRPGGWRR